MPTRFLSNAQRDRRTNWPDALTFEEFAVYFTLTQRDCTFLKTFRPSNRLGTALQLVALRALGFVLEDALLWLGEQLKIQAVQLWSTTPNPYPAPEGSQASPTGAASVASSTRASRYTRFAAFCSSPTKGVFSGGATGSRSIRPTA